MLTDVQIRKAKATDRPYKLTDGGGLHVCVTPPGGKLWRLRYEFDARRSCSRSVPTLRPGSVPRVVQDHECGRRVGQAIFQVVWIATTNPPVSY
jgi:hypothetical protein